RHHPHSCANHRTGVAHNAPARSSTGAVPTAPAGRELGVVPPGQRCRAGSAAGEGDVGTCEAGVESDGAGCQRITGQHDCRPVMHEDQTWSAYCARTASCFMTARVAAWTCSAVTSAELKMSAKCALVTAAKCARSWAGTPSTTA